MRNTDVLRSEWIKMITWSLFGNLEWSWIQKIVKIKNWIFTTFKYAIIKNNLFENKEAQCKHTYMYILCYIKIIKLGGLLYKLAYVSIVPCLAFFYLFLFLIFNHFVICSPKSMRQWNTFLLFWDSEMDSKYMYTVQCVQYLLDESERFRNLVLSVM